MAKTQSSRRPSAKKQRRNISQGLVFINASFNNTLVTITDTGGNVVAWSSAGRAGFKGSRKSTPYAAQLAGREAARSALDSGVVEVHVFVKGPGPGRESALRALAAQGLRVRSIKDITPIPHNGCRPRKRRRV